MCWEGPSDEVILKRTAVPSIFQHSTPLVYMERLYAKLKSANKCPALVEEGLKSIKKLEKSGALEDHFVPKEVVRLSRLMGISALQKVRLNLKTAEIASMEVENCILAEEVGILEEKLKCVVKEK